jgi:thiol-disulfide isomerase/thioredoxin
MRWVTIILLLIVAVALGVAYFQGGFITSREEGGGDNFLDEDVVLSDKGVAPELVGIEGWINSEPLTLEGLRGKVVLIDFWTYSCINCIRTFPHLSVLYERYKDDGFVLLGVHAPEFDFEKDPDNVRAAVLEHSLPYPVALDPEHDTWRAFENRYWPAHYLIDAEGRIRYTHFGEGKYAETEAAVQQLLLEAGLLTIDTIAEVVEPPVTTDFSGIGTPEIYLGYTRINNVGNMDEEVPIGESYTFEAPEVIVDNRFYFDGTWQIGGEFAETMGEAGLVVRYKASNLNMVLDVARAPVEVELLLDGLPLTEENGGADVLFRGGRSFALIDGARLYDFVDVGEYAWHTLEIIIPSAGLRAFTFTFG